MFVFISSHFYLDCNTSVYKAELDQMRISSSASALDNVLEALQLGNQSPFKQDTLCAIGTKAMFTAKSLSDKDIQLISDLLSRLIRQLRLRKLPQLIAYSQDNIVFQGYKALSLNADAFRNAMVKLSRDI
jgi:hypothetical protein